MAIKKELLQIAFSQIEKKKEFLYMTVASTSGSVPGRIGFCMLLLSDGATYGTIGGGILEYEACAEGKRLLAAKSSGLRTYHLTNEKAGSLGMVCGGSMDVSFRYVSPNDRDFLEQLAKENERISDTVYIFGGGHVAQALVPLLTRVGFDCIVYDDRKEFANKRRFPNATRLVVADYGKLHRHVEIKEGDYVCIMTRGHEYDYLVQKQVLKTPAKYIGVMGSRKKTAVLNEKLRNDGFSETDLARAKSPIGLSIGAQTPEEIAVSIAAELIQKRYE